MAFDGADIWILNSGDSVTELRASDGTNLKTVSVPPGAVSMAFDGANIWVASYKATGAVTEIQASTGEVLGSFLNDYVVDGGTPISIAFDGANMWVATDYEGEGVLKIQVSNGEVFGGLYGFVGLQGTFSADTIGMAFDGVNMWVTGFNELTAFRTSDLALLGNFSIWTQGAVAFDGANVWVACSFGCDVNKF